MLISSQSAIVKSHLAKNCLEALPSFESLDFNAKGGEREEKTIDKLAAPGLCLLLIRAEGFLRYSQIRDRPVV